MGRKKGEIPSRVSYPGNTINTHFFDLHINFTKLDSLDIKMMKKMACLLILLMWTLTCFLIGAGAQTNATVPVKVGIVLDLSSTTAKMGWSCINMSLSDFYASHSHYKTRLVFTVRDSHGDVVTAAARAVDLIKTEQVQAIIGPSTSMEANFVISLGAEAHVPILTFSATSPSLASLGNPYFFQIAQNDSAQVNAINAIVQAFGWKEAVPIYVDNDCGKGAIHSLTNALQQAYVRIPYMSGISPSATDEEIKTELSKLMTNQTRVFVVHMSTNIGTRLFSIAKQIGMMSKGYVWIVTDGLGNVLDSFDSSVIESMQGVLGVKSYVPKTKKLDDFEVRWKRKFIQDNPTLSGRNLKVFGLWAYDVTRALAMAVEQVGTSNLGFDMSNASGNSSDLQSLGVSPNGEKLREAISRIKFRGLSGEFNVVNGQLPASTFEIANVVGNGQRTIGFWTPQNGLVRNLSSTNTSTYSASKKDLAKVIWPGEPNSVPKGWEIPVKGTKLRVGVPVKAGYKEFVNATLNPITNHTKFEGLCIDVFGAVVQALPYDLPYEFIPFPKMEAVISTTPMYNDLISQVYFGNFDAAVADITIIANRSNHVDFTFPYTESGVTMIVPVKDKRKKNAWAFLQPLTWDLWVTTACSFVFIGFVVWVLEHRINEHFRGPPSHQIGTSLWFSLSTMVFAHRERVVSNLSRFVVIIWIFVVLILSQSYTASLTSLLTVEQLSPTVKDVNMLIKNRLNVGYMEGSFVYEVLKDMGFQDYQLKIYNSTESCHELFERGIENGGIAAAIDEIPYVKLFLGNYCSKYTTVDPTFKTGGFGFAFPKGSLLIADISRAILNVTQGEKMKTIENKWLNGNKCPDSKALVSSNSLGLESFWGLFLIAGLASVSSLIIFAVTFLHQNRNMWSGYNGGASIWRRIKMLLRIFDQRDESSHTFRKKERASPTHGLGPVEASPTSQCPPSPSSEGEFDFSLNGNGAVFSGEFGDANPPNAYLPQNAEITVRHWIQPT
ncbi:glutamate receptor 2.9-like [Neltuma alba]|uniref:glutamate receptor 2.9-like n=1 Tax=Neltuma alba TaxID=207710 RepID=UPI0010A3927B|nr:glutamate receptor 2.9-like [Prosopis alba]